MPHSLISVVSMTQLMSGIQRIVNIVKVAKTPVPQHLLQA